MADSEPLPPDLQETLNALTGPDSPLVKQWAQSWAHFDARAVAAWCDLMIDGEHTLPDGRTIHSNGAVLPCPMPMTDGLMELPSVAIKRDRDYAEPAPCYDFGSVWDAIASIGDTVAPGGSHADYKPCMPVACPEFEDMTMRVAAPVVPPPWVRVALDRIGRDWSAYLTGTAGVAYDGTGRVETRPALAGGYWLTEVPDETPLIVETLCEECTGYEGGDGNA